ncbi:hypothetical protein NGM37_02400, partial [Streptomyces sp. TRM76130]|nr:hypothetical protein [Streptomyces sp. TRM76130]
AAVVQRREGDGEWIGQSNDYRFRVVAGDRPETDATGGTDATDGTGPADGTDATGTASPLPSGRVPFADELAGTGLGRAHALLAAGALLAAAGGTAVALARRRR